MHCSHEPSGEMVWEKTEFSAVKLHPVCANCGTLKNVSSSRGKKLGYFISVLSRLREYCKISEAQLRLIAKELERNEDFCDLWWISYERQRKIFINVVKKYVNVNTQVIESLL
ncbi:MAG: hypothetical protein V6S10_00390 [Candidatus Methanoglobus sp.]